MTRKECILCIGKSDSVLDAMMTMHKNGVPSVAIIDHQSKMVGTISLSDVKVRIVWIGKSVDSSCFFSNHDRDKFIVEKKLFSIFWKSCNEFINYVRCQQALESHGGKVKNVHFIW
jgi:hypothetical protein